MTKTNYQSERFLSAASFIFLSLVLLAFSSGIRSSIKLLCVLAAIVRANANYSAGGDVALKANQTDLMKTTKTMSNEKNISMRFCNCNFPKIK